MLRVDGTVVVSPGRLVELSQARVVDEVAQLHAPASDGATLRTRPSLAQGEGLARAAQLIADTDGSIARWHDN